MVYVTILAVGMQPIAVCPPAIKDVQTVSVDRTWVVRVPDFPRPLEEVAIYRGNPKNRQSLLGESVGRKGMKWMLKGTDVWVECMYLGSSAILSKQVGAVKSCLFVPAEESASDSASLSCAK